MEAWNDFIRDCRDRYGVGTAADAATFGIPEVTFYRRSERERWRAPYPGVRVAAWVEPSPLTELSALLQAAGPDAAATGMTAAWLYHLREAPRRLQIVVPHGHRVPRGAEGRVRRSRWLRDTDVTTIRRLRALEPAAMVVSLAGLPVLELRGLVIDALHQDLVELPAIVARLSEVGPVRGRGALARLLFDLADRDVESIFHDLVLDELARLGYLPGREPVLVRTPDGRGVRPDVPLPLWRIAIEVQGDAFHRTRAQRAADRRKTSQYAGSGWLVLEVDWCEWVGNRDHFLAALDAAILTQVRNGVSPASSLPPHLRQRWTRAQNLSPGADHVANDRNGTR